MLKLLLETIECVASREYQERVWMRGEGPEVADYDEVVCLFFGDVDGILNNREEFPMTEAQYKLLKYFRDEFCFFVDENDEPQDFIDTPEWARIMQLAQGVLKAFNYKPKYHFKVVKLYPDRPPER